MSPTYFSLFIALFLSFSLPLHSTTPYVSPNTLFPNYQNMLKSFKVFTYTAPEPLIFSTTPESLFFSSLQNSPFITQDPEQAHLFFVPFSSHRSTRSLGRLISRLRNDFPFWNRTLGADHFYISCQGLSFNSDRNILELKKNSVQISCFPTLRTEFVPHKDITLPPFADLHRLNAPTNKTKLHLGFVRFGAVEESSLITELLDDPDFYVESGPSDELTYQERLENSKFCLFEYGKGDISGISDAMRFGCVPVVMTDRPIQDLPLLDVLRWQEIAVFVGWNEDKGVKVNSLKKFLYRTWRNEQYEEVSRFCVMAGRHFVWNEEPQPYDAFHMVMYQLWLRRHVIRYARREVA
ncbi:probable glycosyltransferase At5g25310 [Mangifera indica]|uniref:probable glycosyltransferase At5g25310 n=1 Tax=Mangifera indica TaxID=29780 RepID=UPI001CFB17F7|nr:probable glycosyltransferase At5g25310 [Mangifera indica]